MPRPTLLAALAGASLLPIQPVFAHGFAGPHMFVSTLIIDDPNVADEASLPTFSYLPQPSDGGPVSRPLSRPNSNSTNASPRTSASPSTAATNGSPSQA